MAAPTTLLVDDRTRLKRFQKSLLGWYSKNHRDLPWRRNPTLYRVWLSEIMLQQTQVDTVIPYYRRFLKSFPNVKRLADAKIDDVLKLWEGLGYYRRARSLHVAAQQIRDEFSGRIPISFEKILSLPGVGRYTAGAILSIAKDAQVPILEGNTIRLFARLLNLDEDIKQTSTQNTLWTFAESILPESECGNFNQALMELGNQVCKPKQPDCKTCPVSQYCEAHQANTAEQLPFNSAKQKSVELFESLFIVQWRGKMLMRKCQAGERWQGLYDFPRLMNLTSKPTPGTLCEFVDRELGVTKKFVAGSASPFWQTVHHVTKYKINLSAFSLGPEHSKLVHDRYTKTSGFQWYDHAKLNSLPLNKTAREAYLLLESKES